MQLPLSSSINSQTDSEDGLLSQSLRLADSNAEINRFAFSHYDEYSDVSPASSRAYLRSINFNPEVSVRFIRPRSNTMKSNLSDASVGSGTRFPESPIGRDAKQLLKESSPISDDEEFDRFYKTMRPMKLFPTRISTRRLSMDDTPCIHEESPRNYRANRTRSISCDDNFFQTINFS